MILMKTPEFAADNNVARKTPEEIKNALDLCSQSGCPDCAKCAYDGNECCLEEKSKDALVYIQQLESRLAQTERERDAAISELANSCYACRFILDASHCEGCFQRDGKYPWSPMVRTKFEWRGVCEKNTKEANQ